MENQLPTDVIRKITSTLSLKEILNCKLVCKLWHDHIPTPLPAKIDRQFVLFDLESSKFAVSDGNAPADSDGQTISFPSTFRPAEAHLYRFSSCNGLVCFFSPNNRNAEIYICNPTIGECVSVPKPSIPSRSEIESYDLGFCPCSNQYKLTRFVTRNFDDETTELEIYTFGSPDGWRRHAGAVPSRIWFRREGAVCVRGVLHWLLLNPNPNPNPNNNNKRSILTLDMEEEKFGSVPLPRVGDEKRIHSLGYMDGCLVVTAGDIINSPLEMEIWARREYRAEEPVWTKNWVIDDATQFLCPFTFFCSHLIPRKLSSDGRIFVTFLNKGLYCYDHKDRLVTFTSKSAWPRLTAYTTSGVSPNQLMQHAT